MIHISCRPCRLKHVNRPESIESVNKFNREFNELKKKRLTKGNH